MDEVAPVTGRGSVEDQMRAELKVAMRARDGVVVRALRTALAAIANAEAPPMTAAAASSAGEPVVGELVEHRRLDLSAADIDRILQGEIADRQDTAEQFEAHGRVDEADVVRAEAAVIARFLG